MTTQDALLAAILSSPADDLPRLVYADFLEERGDPERAEFIRVQVEIASVCGDRKLPMWSEQMQAVLEEIEPLRQRERLLWESGTNPLREWFGVAGKDVNLFLSYHGIKTSSRQAYVVTRGFVSEIRCTLAEWVGGGCGTCDGRRLIGDAVTCFECHGTGRTVGIGPEVVRRHPVQVVTLTDREPWKAEDGLWEYTVSVRPVGPHAIPYTVHDMFPGGQCKPTREESTDALSAALIAWAKSQPIPART